VRGSPWILTCDRDRQIMADHGPDHGWIRVIYNHSFKSQRPYDIPRDPPIPARDRSRPTPPIERSRLSHGRSRCLTNIDRFNTNACVLSHVVATAGQLGRHGRVWRIPARGYPGVWPSARTAGTACPSRGVDSPGRRHSRPRIERPPGSPAAVPPECLNGVSSSPTRSPLSEYPGLRPGVPRETAVQGAK